MINSNKSILLATVIVAAIASTQVYGQETGFSADMDSRLTYEDNILRATDANAISDTSLVVVPELKLGGILGKQRFTATYAGEYANYFDNSDVSYTDHDIRLRADFDHSYRFTSRFDLRYKNEHEDIADSNNIFNNLGEFNTFSEKQVAGKFIYGRHSSLGQLELGLSYTDRDYDNNEQEFRSFERNLASLGFYYRVAPRTRLLAEVIYQDYEYSSDTNVIDRDFEYLIYRVGVEWALTNQLEGTVKIGYQDRDYALDTLNDIDGLSYEANLDWELNTYTAIGLLAKRESIESSVESTGGFLRTTFGVSVVHGFTELTKIEAEIGYSEDELVFGIVADRQDERRYATFGVLHDLRAWVEVGANLSFEGRDSNVELANYKVNSINLTAKISFN